MARVKKAALPGTLHKPVAKFSGSHEQLQNQAGKDAVITREFNYKEFAKIAGKIPFTRREWADILHISERTLQRYAKDNGVFNFGVADRILQIEMVINRGAEVFGNVDKFLLWLKDNPVMLEGRLSLQSLGSIGGTNMVLTQLGRIEHGLLT